MSEASRQIVTDHLVDLQENDATDTAKIEAYAMALRATLNDIATALEAEPGVAFPLSQMEAPTAAIRQLRDIGDQGSKALSMSDARRLYEYIVILETSKGNR